MEALIVYCYTDEKIRIVLKDLRISRGLSQLDVANRLDCTKAYISQIERGKVSIPNYRKLLKILEIYKVKPKYFEELLSKC